MNTKQVLILAPHTDDGELGCGGTIARLLEEGYEAHYAAFSTCEESVPAPFPKDTLEKEVKSATAVLGICSENLYVYKYPVRRFSEHRQDILEEMIRMRKKINPALVFLPNKTDIHQDHHVISEEGSRAFKKATLLGYEMVWNNFCVNTNAFFRLEQRHIDRKIDALQQYASQQGLRNYMNREFVESLAKVRGAQIAEQYAEAFEVQHCII